MKIFIELIFLIILGSLSSLSLPPINFLFINFLTFSLFFLFLVKKSKEHKNFKLYFLYGWLFGFGYFVTNLYWISISLSFDQNFKYLIPITILIIPAFLSLFYGLVSYLFLILKPKKIVSSVLFFSLIFGSVEFVRGSILTGFPWNLIAYSFSNQLEILSIISIIGTYGFNLFCITLFTCPIIFILRNNKRDLGFLIVFLILISIFYFHGNNYKKKFYEAEKKNFNYKIRVVGSNISLDRFYLNIDPVSIIQDLIQISHPKPNEKIIFVWPEGILPEIYQNELKEYEWLFDKNFDQNHLLILGINSQSIINGSNKFFNTFSIYDNKLNLINSYKKINLVPFGEFLPLENILKNFGLKSITNNYRSFSNGDRREIIEIKNQESILKILPLICYEIIYSGKIFDNPEFDLIINISEDGWFGKSIGPKQHFVHSIFRAIESGKYLIRSSNNGTTGIINPLGIIEDSVDFGETGYVDFIESRKIQSTIFSKYGNKVFGLLILLYIFLIFSFNRIKNEQS
jgi:apolipoprotein N-acyltransferase